jgi:class 3 adenylate cyclase
MRSADRVQKCLLFGIDRTYRRHVLNDANDPEADVAIQAPCDPLQQRGEVALAREQRKLAAILAADVVGYSLLMRRRD